MTTFTYDDCFFTLTPKQLHKLRAEIEKNPCESSPYNSHSVQLFEGAEYAYPKDNAYFIYVFQRMDDGNEYVQINKETGIGRGSPERVYLGYAKLRYLKNDYTFSCEQVRSANRAIFDSPTV